MSPIKTVKTPVVKPVSSTAVKVRFPLTQLVATNGTKNIRRNAGVETPSYSRTTQHLLLTAICHAPATAQRVAVPEID
jgi:hypothetical protein